jgi:hypothetical protein
MFPFPALLTLKMALLLGSFNVGAKERESTKSWLPAGGKQEEEEEGEEYNFPCDVALCFFLQFMQILSLASALLSARVCQQPIS